MLRQQGIGRTTSSGHFIPQIDGLRCAAMLLVIAHHVFAAYLEQTHRLGTRELPRDWALIAPRDPLVMWALHAATAGVPLFCLISGFVLTLPFALSYLRNTPPPLYRSYLLRRLARIDPPYILNLLFLYVTIMIPWHQKEPYWYARAQLLTFAPHLLASLVYLHGFIYEQASWVNGVAWTLEIEIQFYVLLPLVAKLFLIRQSIMRRALLLALVTGSALFSQFAVRNGGSLRLSLSLPVLLQYFLAGVLMADIYLDPPRIAAFGSRAGDAVALLSSALLIYMLHWQPALEWTAPILMICFCLAAFRGFWISRFLNIRALTAAGAMSYTTYLYHFFVIRQVMPYTVRLFPSVHALWWDSGVQFLLLLVPILAVSAVLFPVTEKPFLILSQQISRRLRAARPAALISI